MNKITLGALSLIAAISLNATVFATVNGKDVTEVELTPLLAGMQGVDISKLKQDEKRNLINRGIELQLLIDQAKKSGVENDPMYKKELDLAKDQIAFRVWQAKKFNEIKISDKDVSDFYNKNKNSFLEPAQVKAKHILVKDEKEANAILSQLKKLKGDALDKKFSELAKSKSKDTSAQNGGDLGWFSSKQMIKPFSDAAFALKKGEMTNKVIKTQFGYHIILKTDEKVAKQHTLEEAKPYITEMLKEEAFKKSLQKEADDLLKNAKVIYK